MRDEQNNTTSRVFVGTSGWSYADWQGTVYPSSPRSGKFDPLKFMAKYFDALEINVSFYRPLTRRMTEDWVRRLGDESPLRFAAKVHKRFTHQRDAMFTGGEVREFIDGLEPLLDADRLGALLMQFPWSFRNNPKERDWLTMLSGAFGHLPLVAELRHDSWATDESIAFLARLQMNYCNIDQPRLGHCIGPTAIRNGPVGYFRFHGRNAENWFGGGRDDAAARYDYLYDEAELAEWVDRIREVARQGDETYVFTNNHYHGQAPANALQLKSLLTGENVLVPPVLANTYPILNHIAADEPGRQKMLFE